ALRGGPGPQPSGPGGPRPGGRRGRRDAAGHGRGRPPGRALLPARPRPSPVGATAHRGMSLFRDKGVALRSYRLGEADRIVVFLTERLGKVRAVAKGVRKTTSKFGARLEPLTHVDL